MTGHVALLNLNCGGHMVPTTTLYVAALYVVLLASREIDPVRLGIIVLPEETSSIGMPGSSGESGSIERVRGVKAHIQATIVITCQVEAISCGCWRNEPAH